MTDPRNVPTTTDLTVPVREINRAPIISADQYSHVGKYAGALVLSAFEMMGGLPRFAEWASDNPSSFYEKIFPKMIQRSAAVEHSGTLTIDDAISRLENQSMRATNEEIEDAPFFDL